MKLPLLLILLIISIEASGKIFVSPGVSATLPHQTEELDEKGEELVNFKTGLGLNLDFEVTLWGPLSLNFTGIWRGGEASSQYDYTNESNPLDTAKVSSIKTNYSSILGLMGARFRFIDLEKINSYVGGGIIRGNQYFTYDENRFILSNGDKIGYQEKEERPFKGHYMEAGLEFLAGKGGSLRISGKKSKIRTEEFETLGARELTIQPIQVTIQYVHPIK